LRFFTLIQCFDRPPKLGFLKVLARMEGVEIGDPVSTQDDRLAIDHELLPPVRQGGFDNPWKTLRPIISPRVISRARSPLRSTRWRHPSYLIS
jgi:hypothetical protein